MRNPFPAGSQNALIFDHLIEHGTITPREAIDLYGCLRLAARIPEIRERAGVGIRAETVRRGRKSWARYRLEGEQLDLLSA